MNDEAREALQQTAMQIILAAGEARVAIRAAYEALAAQDLEGADGALRAAQAHVTRAHKAQTEVIQAEARGETHEPSLLFNHAQDTLMTIKSEQVTAHHMVAVVRSLLARLDAVEERLGLGEVR